MKTIQLEALPDRTALMTLLDGVNDDAVLITVSETPLSIERAAIETMRGAMDSCAASIVYGDSRRLADGLVIERQRRPYQLGSLGPAFDFGPLVLVSMRAVRAALARYGPPTDDVEQAGWYDLRLKLSTVGPVVHVPEPLCLEHGRPRVDPPRGEDDRTEQLAVERAALAHLARIGACVAPAHSPPRPLPDDAAATDAALASIVVPIRDRARTVGAALDSALGQVTSFPFNILVVDDHSTDGTTAIVAQYAARDPRVVHIVPERTDLGIGGLWNEAIDHPACGAYAVQLDSDDVYANPSAVETLVREFWDEAEYGRPPWARAPRYVMVIGSYTYVDVDLRPIPPGHNRRLELSRDQGRNNVLWLDGCGAPRAFYVPVLRRIRFPNVSFGEDYAVALRITRHYDIGRVFEPMYLARQWEDNSGKSLLLGSARSIRLEDMLPAGMTAQDLRRHLRPLVSLATAATASRHQTYRDALRTAEILARQRLNQERQEES